MITIKEVGLYLLLILIFLLVLLTISFVGYMFFSMFRKNVQAPYVNSFNKDMILIKQIKFFEKGKKIVDLGCGDAKLLRFIVKHFSLDATGYDINPFAIYLAKIINKIRKYDTIKIIKSNFMFADLSKFDYIYVYLFPEQLANIEDWLRKNKKENAVIISNSFQFKKHKSFSVIKNKKGKLVIFLYK